MTCTLGQLRATVAGLFVNEKIPTTITSSLADSTPGWVTGIFGVTEWFFAWILGGGLGKKQLK